MYGVIAATNRNLQRMMGDGSFREDLYHRIAMWVAEVPPLRRRRADIPNLAAYFLDRAAQTQGVPGPRHLASGPWTASRAVGGPAMSRQLENEMSRAVLFLEDDELLDTHRLSDAVRSAGSQPADGSLAATLERVEHDEITLAMERGIGATSNLAAEALGISRATLYRRIKALGVST
jgi:transcriptional regulator with PAS, ATPase and Fis domain